MRNSERGIGRRIRGCGMPGSVSVLPGYAGTGRRDADSPGRGRERFIGCWLLAVECWMFPSGTRSVERGTGQGMVGRILRGSKGVWLAGFGTGQRDAGGPREGFIRCPEFDVCCSMFRRHTEKAEHGSNPRRQTRNYFADQTARRLWMFAFRLWTYFHLTVSPPIR